MGPTLREFLALLRESTDDWPSVARLVVALLALALFGSAVLLSTAQAGVILWHAQAVLAIGAGA
jgi:hypothetical protein